MVSYDRILKLSLERGFYFPSSDIYFDSPAGFWEYGPNGNTIKNKFIELWRRELVRRDEMVEIDGSQIMSKNVFIASGHIDNFSDPLIVCSKCKSVLRADKFLLEKEGINVPETCQAIFVDFPRIFKIMRGKLPLGIAQVGKSFRNEIAPRQSLLRLREFYQAEIEVFCNPNKLNDLPRFEEVKNTTLRLYDGTSSIEVTADEGVRKGLLPNKLVAYYLALLNEFYAKTGIDMKRTRLRRLTNTEKAFYSTIAFDYEVETSTGWLELVACNYRSDYDLHGHASTSKQNLEVIDPSDQKKVLPHVFELSMGIRSEERRVG